MKDKDELTYWECLHYYGDVLGKLKWEEQQAGKTSEHDSLAIIRVMQDGHG